MAEVLIKPSETYRHPDQPTFIYDISKPWEEVVSKPPIWLGAYPTKPQDKKYTLFGEPTISPMIIAAGPASGRLWTKFFLDMGYGAVIEKTRRTQERRSNPLHNIAIVISDEPLTPDNIDQPRLGSLNPDDYNYHPSMTNSFGNPSSAIPSWSTEFRDQLLDVGDGQVLAMSVTGTIDEIKEDVPDYFKDIIQRERIIADVMIATSAAVGAGAKAIEFNYACPNILANTLEGEMFQNYILVRDTFQTARLLFPGIKFGLKVGRFTSYDQAKSIIDQFQGNVDFVSSINALSVPILDMVGDPILVGRRRAGTCGEILRDLSLRQIEMIAQIRDQGNLKFEIHAGGGITKPSHVQQFKDAGGDGFFSGSAVLANPLLNNDYLYDQQEQQDIFNAYPD